MSDRDDLKALGAPHWYIVAHSRMERRVSALEQAVIAGAHRSGAIAGRRWGAAISGIVMAISTALAQCDSPQSQSQSQSSAEVQGSGGK